MKKTWIALALMSCFRIVIATSIPVPPPPEIATLAAAKQLPVNGVRLTWSDGSAPFIIVRSETPDFSTSTTITYVSRDASTPTDDPNVLGDTKTYYYQAYDVNAAPQVLTLSASDPVIGDVLTIDGAGFDPATTHVYLEGEEIPLSSVTSSQLQLAVPASAPSGQLIVASSSGISEPRTLNKVYFKNHADLVHVAVDANHDIWVAERGSAATSDKVYKVDHATGAVQSWGTLNECVGLPADSAESHYVGNSTVSSSNRGSIWKIDAAGTSTSWGSAGTATSDPVYVRAMAIDPALNNPTGLTVYALDGNNSDHLSNIRAVTATGHYTYLTIGSTIPSPGGLAINSLGHMLYTLSSSIQEIDSSKSFVFSYGSSLGVSNPAQIDVENASRIWVANKGGNNLLRISTDPADRKALEKVSGLTTPQGVAFDHDPTVDPVTGLSKSYVYVAEQTRLSRFRVYDTVWINVVVLNESIAQHTILDDLGHAIIVPATTKAQQETIINKDLARAKEIFKQAGIDLRLRGTIQWIDDPNADASPNDRGIILDFDTPVLTDEETTLFQTSRSTHPLDINVYYVLGISASQGSQGYLAQKWGETFTNDWITGMNNQTQSGIIVCRYGRDLSGNYQLRNGRDSALAHELGHFLLDATIDWEHNHSTDPRNLMCPVSAAREHNLDAEQISNIQNNSDESEFIERF
jgi:hypothetical protein